MNQRQEIELTPEQAMEERRKAQEFIDKANRLERLQNDPPFKEFIMEGYLKDEAQRLVGLLGDYSLNHSEHKALHREDLVEQMHGIARLQAYMRFIFIQAAMGEKTLYDLDDRDDPEDEDDLIIGE